MSHANSPHTLTHTIFWKLRALDICLLAVLSFGSFFVKAHAPEDTRLDVMTERVAILETQLSHLTHRMHQLETTLALLNNAKQNQHQNAPSLTIAPPEAALEPPPSPFEAEDLATQTLEDTPSLSESSSPEDSFSHPPGWKLLGPLPPQEAIESVGGCPKARQYLATGKVKEARNLLTALTTSDPKNPEASYLLGTILLWQDKKYAEAYALFVSAYGSCKNRPQDVFLALQTLLRLAEVLIYQGKPKESADVLLHYRKRSEELWHSDLTPENKAQLKALDTEEKKMEPMRPVQGLS